MTVETNIARARTAIDSWNAGDLDGYLTLYADSVRLHGYTPEAMGKAEVAEFYRGIVASFGGPKIEVHDIFGAADDICIRFTMTGRHTAEFMGVAATERDIALPGITVLRFADGQCVEPWASADMLGLLTQLGAVPAPRTGAEAEVEAAHP